MCPPGRRKGGPCVWREGKRDGGVLMGEYVGISRQRVHSHVYVCLCVITHLLKQPCNYPKLCLVGPASIPVEQQTIWAPAQICEELSC